MSTFSEYCEEAAAWLRAGAEGRPRSDHPPEAFIVIAEHGFTSPNPDGAQAPLQPDDPGPTISSPRPQEERDG